MNAFQIFSRMFTAAAMLAALVTIADVAKAERYAIVVGVKQYRVNQPLPPVEYAENDAEDLAKVLEHGGYQVTLMTQSESAKPGKANATPGYGNIHDRLEGILKHPYLDEEDVVIVAFAGHGVQYELVEGEKRTPKFYFCPADADVTELETANQITAKNMLLDLGEVYDALKECKAGGKLLLVDACRNDPTKELARNQRSVGNQDSAIRALASKTLPPLPPPPGGTAVFFSCSAHQVAYEDAELKHGVFFHHVIDALTGNADSSTTTREADGRITLAELTEHVSRGTYDYVFKKYGGARQAPEMNGVFRVSIPIVDLNGRGAFRKDIREERLPETEKPPVVENPVPRTEADPVFQPHPLLAQGETYLKSKEYDAAITAFSAVVKESTDAESRRQARIGRGSAYVARGRSEDIDRALADQLAAGQPGVVLTVLAPSAEVRVISELKGTVKKGQKVLVSSIAEDWLWVISVDGRDSLQGYIERKDVLAQAAPAQPAPPQPAPAVASTRSFQPTQPAQQFVQPRTQPAQNFQPRNNSVPSGPANDRFIDNFIQKNGRPPSIWQTPKWESPAEVRRLRAAGRVR